MGVEGFVLIVWRNGWLDVDGNDSFNDMTIYDNRLMMESAYFRVYEYIPNF